VPETDRVYHHVLRCPCGESLSGDTEDELVEVAFAHLRDQHPDMAEDYEREHVLFMSMRVPKPQP
jgi:predicted small metal-binding protein